MMVLCAEYPRQVSRGRRVEESKGEAGNTLAANQRKISGSTEDPDGDTRG